MYFVASSGRHVCRNLSTIASATIRTRKVPAFHRRSVSQLETSKHLHTCSRLDDNFDARKDSQQWQGARGTEAWEGNDRFEDDFEAYENAGFGRNSGRDRMYNAASDGRHSRHRQYDHDMDFHDSEPRTSRRPPQRSTFSSQRDDFYDEAPSGYHQLGSDIETPAWDSEQLDDVSKDYYREHDNVSARSDEEIREYLKKHDVKIIGTNVPRPIFNFDETQFPSSLVQQLQMDFKAPTVIQAVTWPIAMSGRDMIGVAQTGSGKTLSFLLPGMVHNTNQPPTRRGDGPSIVVMCPTRELCVQSHMVAQEYCAKHGVKHTCVYGGANKQPQARELRNGVSIVVATPGRLLDFIQSGITNLKRCTYLVLDEADRMLDMGFEPQIRQIVRQIRPDHQTLMWSATWPKDVQELAGDFLAKDAIMINVGSLDISANRNIEQHVEVLDQMEKFQRLQELLPEWLDNKSAKILIFAQTKRTVDNITIGLRRNGYRPMAIHGDKSQAQREWVLDDFRNGKTQILVATDVAARGLDVDDITVVVNYDYPNEAEDYVHRIGRTGRVNKKGISHTFFCEGDFKKADGLIQILKEAGQEVNPDLLDLRGALQKSRKSGKQRGGDYDRYSQRGGGRQMNQRYRPNSFE